MTSFSNLHQAFVFEILVAIEKGDLLNDGWVKLLSLRLENWYDEMLKEEASVNSEIRDQRNDLKVFVLCCNNTDEKMKELGMCKGNREFYQCSSISSSWWLLGVAWHILEQTIYFPVTRLASPHRFLSGLFAASFSGEKLWFGDREHLFWLQKNPSSIPGISSKRTSVSSYFGKDLSFSEYVHIVFTILWA